MRLLLVEDAVRLRTLVSTALSKMGHTVDAAADGEEGALQLTEHAYDVIILDVMLPGLDGFSLLERLRGRGDTTPVLMLTARESIDDRVRGLSAGADDYLVKPFALAELAARLDALHRRRHGVVVQRLTIGRLELDLTARRVWRDGSELALTAREYALLEFFALRPRRILTREQIEAHLYPDGGSVVSNAVDSAVCLLRRKLGGPEVGVSIHTRRGLGYTLEPA
jgi:two-component system copper resistance phosphate regulon response regulator CusR